MSHAMSSRTWSGPSQVGPELQHRSLVLYVSTLPRRMLILFFNDCATPEIYTLSLHDALPIFECDVNWIFSLNRATRIQPMHARSEEHTSELQSHSDLVCRLLLEKKKVLDHDQRLDHRHRTDKRDCIVVHDITHADDGLGEEAE